MFARGGYELLNWDILIVKHFRWQDRELPTTYLDMPLGAKSKPLSIWNFVVEKS